MADEKSLRFYEKHGITAETECEISLVLGDASKAVDTIGNYSK